MVNSGRSMNGSGGNASSSSLARIHTGIRTLLLLTLGVFLAWPALAKDDEGRIKAVLQDRYQQWLVAENKKDAAALANFYDEDAVLMPSKEEPVIGKAAIAEWYRKLVANPRFAPFTLALDWNSFHVVGDIAIATAVFDGDLTRNEKQIHFRGKHLLVWKKQKDGAWKMFRYMYDEIPATK